METSAPKVMNGRNAKLFPVPSTDKILEEAHAKFDCSKEKILASGLNQPFEPANSSPRKIMFYNQSTQRVNLSHPEVPLISTSYENEMGKWSSSVLKTSKDWTVLARIEKYSNIPGHHFFLIVYNEETREFNVIERQNYYHSTESFGYMIDTGPLDNAAVGSFIKKGTVVKKSTAYDEYGNHMDGINLVCSYVSHPKTTEDPVRLSRSAAKKLSFPMISKCELIINDNGIPLNLYGNNDGEYKIFPDIGESINNGLLAAIRNENKDDIFFNQAKNRLSEIHIDDSCYTLEGKVIDINVYSNKQPQPGESEDDMYSCYEEQLKKYILDDRRFCREVVDFMSNYIENSDYHVSYELEKLYRLCEKKLHGAQYINDGKSFSNIRVEIYVYNENAIHEGDKVCNRYGGKGVVSEIVPDELMPRLEDGTVVDVIWNIATCGNRLNTGQLLELSLNNISRNLVKYMDSNIFHADECLDLIFEFMEELSPTYAEEFRNFMERNDNDDDLLILLDEFLTEARSSMGLALSLKPITECVTFDKVMELYKKFPWIHTEKFIVPQKGSNGRYRYIKTYNESIAAVQYIYRLKQCAEEKHSANSLSSTNLRGENAKSRASKVFMAVHSSTPIRAGEMESGIYMHLGPETYCTNLLLYSTSPTGRRSVSQLINGDTCDIDVHLDKDAKSRSVEKLNAIMKSMGLRLVFVKIPKILRPAFVKVKPAFVKVRSAFVKVKPGETPPPSSLNIDQEAMKHKLNYEKSIPVNMGNPFVKFKNPFVKVKDLINKEKNDV